MFRNLSYTVSQILSVLLIQVEKYSNTSIFLCNEIFQKIFRNKLDFFTLKKHISVRALSIVRLKIEFKP